MGKQKVEKPARIISDFGNSLFDPEEAKRSPVQDCRGIVAFVLADVTATTPLEVESSDPKTGTYTCTQEGEHVPRPLQTFEGKPLFIHAVNTALEAGCDMVYVITPDDDVLEQETLAALGREKSKMQPEHAARIGSLHGESAGERAVRRRAQSAQLFGIGSYLLSLGKRALGTHPAADALLFLSCDQVRIETHHLVALRQRLAQHQEADAVTSWITWLRRTPILVSKNTLEMLDGKLPCPHGASPGYRPLPSLDVEEVVFGEERLAATDCMPATIDDFFAHCHMTALEAVWTARGICAAEYPEQALEKARCNRNAAEQMLLESALHVRLLLESEILAEDGFAAELEAASTWAQRNKMDFPIFRDRTLGDGFVYLDTAATAQRPQQVLEAQHTFDAHENANVYRGAYDLSMQATYSLNDARKVLEDFIGAERRETIFTSNTTTACNLVAQAWGERNIAAGDLIIIALNEHHSNMVPWMMLAKRKGARIGFIPVLPDGSLDLAVYDELLRQGAKLVCVAHISNVIGLVNPVQEMARRAHMAGARILVDGAQSLPHLPVNVRELDCDFFAFSGHKLYGPLGIGGLWVHPRAYAEMEAFGGGGGAISHTAVDSYYLRLGSIAYELGTPPISQAIGLAAAIGYLGEIGMDKVAWHSALLTRYLVCGLRQLEGVSIWGEHCRTEGLTGLVSISIAGAERLPAQASMILGKLGVAVRSGGHCALPLAASMGVVGTTRLSLGIYNTAQDIEAALTAIDLCVRLLDDDIGGV